MKSAFLPVPGIMLGTYPERIERRGESARHSAYPDKPPQRSVRRYQQLAERTTALTDKIAKLDSATITIRLQRLRSGLAARGFTNELVVEAFALIAASCSDTLGKRPYESQLVAAAIMLDGQLAEMATGEGKTIAAAVCAATAALAGIPVHLMTANDYLVTRDAQMLAPLYRSLGLSVGAVTQSMNYEARRHAYACNITYGTAKEIAFDYLRDRLAQRNRRDDLLLRAAQLSPPLSGSPLLRGLCMAIIDEADGILIDEAGVPLVISERSKDSGWLEFLQHALEVAGTLTGADYKLNSSQMQVQLTPRGRDALEQAVASTGNAWRNRQHREETVCLALTALHLYCRDRHYLVCHDRVEIIDETTGRLAAGRVWSRGLHQLIELKEACQPSEEQVTAAQITYQRFFRRYLRLSGSSGTLTEARGELREIYGLRVVRVPLRNPGRRRVLPTRLYPDRDTQWQSVAVHAVEISRSGRPVLIGTDSVASSESLSRRLTAMRVEHAVLNARQDEAEADLIASAGQAGRITVTTNIAGRGTDIPLAAGIAERGGLHVICCQHNISPRIDRQLIGRCARQGDPGSAETLIAADRSMLARWIPACLRTYLCGIGMNRPQWLVHLLLYLPQWWESVHRRDQRRALLARDLQTDRHGMFGGPGE